MSDAGPRFTDQQMALILKRAAELQATGEEPVHTLEAIQQIAEQVGIDPQRIAEAAAAVQAPGAASSHLLFGATHGISTHQAGRGLARGRRPRRAHRHHPGSPPRGRGGQGIRRRIRMACRPADNKTAIAFTPAPGGIAVRVNGRYFAPKFGLFISAGALTFVTGLAGLGVSPELGAGLGLGMFALSFTTARLLWNRVASRGRRSLERLLGVLVEQLGRSSPDSSEPPSALTVTLWPLRSLLSRHLNVPDHHATAPPVRRPGPLCPRNAPRADASGVHPRRHPARGQRRRAILVGRRVLRPACPGEPLRQQHRRAQSASPTGSTTRRGDADRPAGTAGGRQRRAGREATGVAPRRERVVRRR